MANHTGYEIAHGGMVGRDHRHVPKNYQDGVCVIQEDWCTVGIVTDGCGSSPHSEVGAQLGARLLCRYMAKEVRAVQRDLASLRFERVRQDTLSSLHLIARELGDSLSQAVMDYLLFTTVGFVLAGDQALFFSVGDGVVVINGEVTVLGPFPGNQPPYLAYGLLNPTLAAIEESLRFSVLDHRALDDLEHFLIGCDGVEDLLAAETATLPGTTTLVGPLSQFWEEDKYFRNPVQVERRLKLIARDWPQKDPQPGLLRDDTTLIVGRRLPPPPTPSEGA